MITNILIILANLEAAWLYFVLRDSITRYGSYETSLTWLAGFQIGVSAIGAVACVFLSKKEAKYDFKRLALVATAFTILGLCAALVGGYPFLMGKTIGQ
jgi:hypothetical protein